MAGSKKAGVSGGKIPPRILRLLDANLNRCREGLRVLEDTARFVWNDEALFKKIRTSRHSVDLITREFYPRLVTSRDSQGDHGREVPEKGRARFESVVAANLRRCAESLRVLEEYSKLFSPSAGSKFKSLRFGIYDLEKETLNRRISK